MNSTARPRTVYFHVPPREYSPIDALNRRSAALGSPGYAAKTHGADYNGHRVDIMRVIGGYYTATYRWAGTHTIASGSFSACLASALSQFERGGAGASVMVLILDPESEAAAVAECRSNPQLVPGRPPSLPAWWTWRHDVAVESARDYANPQLPVVVFDHDLLETSADRASYEAAVAAKHGRAWL